MLLDRLEQPWADPSGDDYEAIPDNELFLGAWEDLVRVPQFLGFLRTAGLSGYEPMSTAQRRSVILGYIKSQFDSFTPNRLRALQATALDELLDAHGATTYAGADPWERVRLVGEANVARVMMERYTPEPGMEMAEHTVRSLKIYVFHNTNILQDSPFTPLLSYREIKKSGLNTRFLYTRRFNREVTQNDHHVLFHILLYRELTTEQLPSVFGRRHIIPTEHARADGMVSPFLMYPNELFESGERLAKGDADYLRQKFVQLKQVSGVAHDLPEDVLLDKEVVETSGTWRRIEQTLPEWRALMNRQHLADFTLAQFEEIAKNQLLLSLLRLKHTDEAKFGEVLAILSGAKTIQWDGYSQLLDELIFKPMSLPKGFQFNYPVAMEVEKFSAQ